VVVVVVGRCKKETRQQVLIALLTYRHLHRHHVEIHLRENIEFCYSAIMLFDIRIQS
jgi:uncharacterized protein YgbK (DUF1537 family)